MPAPKRIFISDIQDAIDALARADQPKIVSIVGPTGSGKTKLALDLTRELGTQKTLLVSVDSVALYEDLNIGSAKPLREERDGFRWIGLDHLNLNQVATSSAFVDRVLPEMQAALTAGDPVVVVGGSHFYEQALCIGRLPGNASDNTYQASLAEKSNQELHERLMSLDGRLSLKIHVGDRYRITRYLDLLEHQGFTLEDLSEPAEQRPWREIYTIPTASDDDLDQRTAVLRRRTQNMFAAGWIEEVSDLLKRGASPDCPGLQTIGYRDVVDHLIDGIPLSETVEKIVISHRQLAKVQRTWVRGLMRKSK